MRAFTCTVLFALSSVAYAEEPGSEANPADDHADANDPGSEEGDPEEGDPDANPEDGGPDEPDGNAEPETDSGDPGVDHEDPNDPGSDAPDIPAFEENPIEPEDQDIPELEDDADEDEDEDRLYEWGGEARLVAIVSGEHLNGWETVVAPHGAVAIYALDDTQMLEQGVGSVFVQWHGQFESFGPTDPSGSPAVDFGREITVIVTSEAYAEGLSDALGADAPDSAVLVDSRYLAADVDGAYGVLMPDQFASGHDIRPSRAEGWVVARAEDDSLDWLLGYPSFDTAFGNYAERDVQWDGFEGIDMGAGWEDRAEWHENAPEYALDGVEAIEDDEGMPGEDPGAREESPEDEEARRREEEDRAEQTEPDHPRRDRPERESPSADEGSDQGSDEGADDDSPDIDMSGPDIDLSLPGR